MSFENDIERNLEDAGRRIESWTEKRGQTILHNWGHGIQEIKGYQYLKKEERNIKYGNLAIVIMVAGALYFYAPNLATWIPKELTSIGFKNGMIVQLLQIEPVYWLLAALVPGMFLSILGSSRATILQEYNDKFEMIGLASGSKKSVVDGTGNKVRVMAFPELIRKIEVNDDSDIYLFRPNGNSLESFMKKRLALEQVFDTNIYKIDYAKGTKNVIRMVTVTDQKKEELVELYESQKRFNEKFERIGLVGQGMRKVRAFGGEEETVRNYPEYLQTESALINNKKVQTYSFRSEGTQLDDWVTRRYLMENVLNELVVDITQDTKDKQLYKVRTISTADDLQNFYKWSNEHMDESESVVVLGEGLLEKIKINFVDTPHMLIGGTTNSGKSVLVNCIINQLIHKGWYFIGVDFKRGIEFQKFKDFGPVVFERSDVIDMLKQLQKEYEARMELFSPYGVEKISEYHKLVPPEEHLTFIVLAIDELAEMMEMTKDKKVNEDILDIQNRLSSLARLARAAGIHIIGGTQRPSREVLTGQIKNNMSVRISGRMTDKEPSNMILGSPAATRIPEIKGRYMMTTGADITTFQGYFFEKNDIKPGNYRKGKFLVIRENETETRNEIKSIMLNESYGASKPSIFNLEDDEDEEDEDDTNLVDETKDEYDRIEHFAEELDELEENDLPVHKEVFTIMDLKDPDEED